MFIPTTAQQQKDNSSRFVVVKLMLNMQMPNWRKQFTQLTQRMKEKFHKTSAASLNNEVCKIKQLTPKHINAEQEETKNKVSKLNTKSAANKCRPNQELKYF
jgi:protein gp37